MSSPITPHVERLFVKYNWYKITAITLEQFITLLAFTDEAFDALPDDIYDKFTENRKKVLRYHLISRKVTQEDLDRGKIVTIDEGNEIKIFPPNGSVKLNNAKAKFPSMSAINGVIIEIDQVLLPPDF